MITVNYTSLLDGGELRIILLQALNYTGFLRIYNKMVAKNKDIYENDTTFQDLTEQESFLKDVITSIEYTDYIFMEEYKPYSIKEGEQHIYTQMEIAGYVSCTLAIVYKAFGKEYLTGLARPQIGFLRRIELGKSDKIYIFDGYAESFALDILGEPITNIHSSKEKAIDSNITDDIYGF